MALAGREKAMGLVWFLIGAILVGCVLWSVYDEAIGRRTWKHYAAEWKDLEVARLEKAIADEEKKINKNELKNIAMEREQAKAMLDSGEYKQAVANLQDVNKNYYDAKMQLQFAKADLDEVFYKMKDGEHHGLDVSGYKKHYDEVNNQIKDYAKIEADWEQKSKAAQATVDSYTKKLEDLNSRETKLYEKITPLKRQLKAAKERGAPIDQVVLDDLGKNGPVVWGTVDRCTTCHIPILMKGYEKGKNPFKTHPNLDQIFANHPFESFGCVTCHGGQGRATQIEHKPFEEGDFAHGFEHHWTTPLLRGDDVESSCNKCHLNQFVLDMAPVYSQGKELFVNYGCINCHKVEGLEWAPKIGPDLAKIKDKVYPEWFVAWAKQPTQYLPHTRMPQVPWENDGEVKEAVAYILSKSEPFNWKYGNYPGGGDAAAGAATFQAVGCIACHSMDGKGGTAAPALDRIAEKTTANWIYNWIQQPKNWSDHARMPSLRLTPDEARNVTAYLITKGQAPQADEGLRTALAEQKNIDAGFKVISKYGCYACHNIKGFEEFSRPSVDLTEFGRKDVHELAFGDAKIPETWEAWTQGKLTNPQMYLDERSTSTMPKPNIDDEQRKALIVFLKGQKPEVLPKDRMPFDPVVEKGRQLVFWYNCKQCHVIEGQGGKVSEFITEPNDLPPNLAAVGARLHTEYMDNFLQNPASYPKIRDWLKIRMPTFGFTDEESDALVRYFKKIAGVNTLLEETPVRLNPEMIAAGKALMGPDNFQCASCHIINGVRPAAGPTVWAPDLAYGHGRLRPQFINKWVRDPAKLSPGIRMPGYYPEGGQGPAGILGGDVEKQVEAIVDYIMYLGGYGNAVTEGGSANTTETQPETKPAAPSESAPQASL